MTHVENASAIRPSSEGRPARVRSAVTNGKRLHVVSPGDGKWSRRFADILGEIISDLGGAGAGLSEGQRQIARRCATIAIACERMEGEAAAGQSIDLDAYGTLTDRLGRAFQRLGLKRQAKTVLTLREQLELELEAEAEEAAAGAGEAA
jgi:hypothetical protein